MRVAARPVEGAANEALRRLLATSLQVAPSRITLAGGATARVKLVEIEGLSAEALRSRWPGVDV